MYTLSDETRMRANTRDTSPFPGAPTAANRRRNDKFGADADARRQGNDTFTPAAGGAWTPMGDARRQANDTFTPGGGVNTRANTMTAATAAQTAAVAAAAASSRKKKAATAADENPFRLPPLTGAERAYMARRAKESSIALVDHAHTLDGPVEWQYTGKFRGIQMYRGEGAASEADGMEYLCGVTTMAGSLAEVSAYFDQSTTERMRAKKADDVLDCAVLYAIEEGSSKNPFYRVAVKYTSFEGPSTFSRARDYVYLECQDTFRHASGRRGWVLSMHSIKLPNCPEMEGTVRGSMYHSGYVFVEAERPGYMDVMHSLQINFKATKRLPSFMLNSALKRRITSVIKISREIQMARMGQHALLRKQDLMPKNSRSLCANCARKFTLFIRKTRCRMCGQVVCQSCAPQVDWAAADGDKKKTRICVKCYRTGGSLLPQSQSTTSKNSAEYSDDEDLAEHEHEDTAHMTHSHDDDDEDAAGDDGLEEQTEESVFAQSRFTRTADSMFSFSSEFHIHDLGASKAAAAAAAGGGRSRDLLEDTTFEADMSFSSNFYDTKLHLTPEDTDEELDKRARRYDPNFRSTSIAEQHHDASSSWGYDVPPPPPPPVPTLPSHLSADSLKEHNKRFAGAKKQYQAPPPPPPFPAPMAQQGSGKLVSIKDIRSNYMKGTEKGELPMPPPPPRDSLASPAPPAYSAHYEDDYISRPPSAILSRVRANRSRTIQFAPEGNYRSPEMMQSIQDEHNKRMAELSASTELYNSSSRVAEPDTNAVDDEPFTLEHLEVPAAGAAVDKQEPPVFASIDDNYDNERGPPQTPKETSVAAWEAEQDAEAFYAPVSALELSQVRANRSHTIEFIPQFMQPEGTAEEDEQEGEELSSDDDHGPEMPVELLQAKVEAHTPPRHSAEPVMGHQESVRRSAETAARHSTPRHSSESKTRYSSESKTRHDGLRISTEEEPMRVTEQYANLQIPSGEVIEMPPSPVAQAPEITVGEPTLRFSQTMIPILDLSTQERGSDAQSESAFSMIAEPRESRKFSDIPILGRSTAGSVRESDLDLELLNRPTAVIMEQINANRARAGQFEADEGEYDRSTEIMQDIEAEHKRRMAELNRIALDYTGNRISRLNLVDEDRESMDTVDYERLSGSYRKSSLQQQLGSLEEDYEVRASEALPQFLEGGSSSARASAARVSTSKGLTKELRMSSLEFTPEEDEPQRQSSRAEPKQQAAPSRFTGLEFSLDLLEPRATTDEKAASPRVSIASTAFDDELMSRSTEVIMDQVRSNRARVPKDPGFSESQFRSTAIMKDKELEHKKRMAELAQIARDNRVSTFEARESEDGLAPADRSLLRQVNTAHIDSEWRATVVMDQVHSSHEAKMEELRKKVRDLDDQCRASMASIFSADELDFADLDAEVEAQVAAEPAPAPEPLPKYKHREVPPAPSQSANGGGAATAGKGDENSSRIANLYSVKNLRPVAARRNPVVMHERVSSATLYQQIAQLTELQSQLAAAKDTKDEEAFKKRIKDQYKLLRTLKLRGY